MARGVQFDVLALAKTQGFDKAAADVDRLSKQAKKANEDTKLLSTAIVGLAPALVPVGAAAVAAGAALTGFAATGLLAFKGLQQGWKDGTLQATALGKQITVLQTNLSTLESTAARGVAPGLTTGLKSINSLMPTVNADIAKLSGQLGTIAGNTGAGLVSLFTRLNPLFLSLGNTLVQDSAAFAKWAKSSDGVTKFVDYAQQQLPKVEEVIKSLVITAAHLVEGFAPLGGSVLSTIGLFSKALNLIPVGVLQALAPALVGLKIASTVSAAVNNLNISLAKMAVAEDAATVSTSRLAAATTLLSDTFAAGLNPAIAGAIAGYYLLGPVLDKIAGNTGTFSDQLNTLRGATLQGIPGTADFALKLGAVRSATGLLGKAAQEAVSATKQLAENNAQAAKAAQKHAAAMALATEEMVLENNAAGLLNASLQKLGGNNLGVAQATTAVALANKQAGAQLKATHGQIKGYSDAAIANQQALQGAAAAAIQHGQAVAQQTGSTEKATKAINNDKAALEDQLRSQGRLTPAVQAYIDTLFKIPPTRKTKIDLQSDAALHAAQLLRDTINSIKTFVAISIVQRVEQAQKFTRATGGPVVGGKSYLVNELGQELFVRNNDGASLIPGGPHMWRAPGSGYIVNAGTVKSLRTKIGNLAGSTLQALPGAARAAINAAAAILPFGSPITRALQQEDKALEALVTRRALLANRLKVANQQLAASQQAFNQEVTNVRSGVLGSFDLLNAGKNVYGQTTAAGLLNDLQSSVQNAGLFSRDLKALQGHLNKNVLQQLAEAGPSAALPTLQALVAASPGQLRQFNSLYGQLGDAGTVAGRITASTLYAGQIRSQQNLVRALQSQERATDRLEQRLQQTIVKSLRIEIHGGSAAEILKALDQALHINTAAALRRA